MSSESSFLLSMGLSAFQKGVSFCQNYPAETIGVAVVAIAFYKLRDKVFKLAIGIFGGIALETLVAPKILPYIQNASINVDPKVLPVFFAAVGGLLALSLV